MKKNLTIVLILILVLMFSACGNSFKNIEEINYKKYQEMIKDKKDFILYISRTGCHYCDEMRPDLDKVLGDKKLVAYELNLANISEDDAKKVHEDLSIKGTPTTIFYKKGEETSFLNRINGKNPVEEIKNIIEKNGF